MEEEKEESDSDQKVVDSRCPPLLPLWFAGKRGMCRSYESHTSALAKKHLLLPVSEIVLDFDREKSEQPPPKKKEERERK